MIDITKADKEVVVSPPPELRMSDSDRNANEKRSSSLSDGSGSNTEDSSGFLMSSENAEKVPRELGFSEETEILEGGRGQRKSGIVLHSRGSEEKLLSQAKDSFCFPFIEKDYSEDRVEDLFSAMEDLAVKTLLAARACCRSALKDIEIEENEATLHLRCVERSEKEKREIQVLYDNSCMRVEELSKDNEKLRPAITMQDSFVEESRGEKARCVELEAKVQEHDKLKQEKLDMENEIVELRNAEALAKEKVSNLQREKGKVAVDVQDGADKAEEAISLSLRSLGSFPGHATDLGNAGKAFGGIGASVALRIVIAEALNLLGDDKAKLQDLQNTQYSWPLVDHYAKVPPMAKSIASNFVKSFWKTRGVQIAVSEAEHLSLRSRGTGG
ncbi:hypothetical protein U9M48_043350 [Paspalum notatum var. saurae]|uniref:Uncharacterized protein n=1 Tax=Paspalum notatum var. saurae TaxID=547442 RepID=A0AAQ3XH99_PASNO